MCLSKTYVVKVAEPMVGSVPACAVTRNWEVLTPLCWVRYYSEYCQPRRTQKGGTELRTVKNGKISVLKLVIVPLVGKNEKTLLAPLEPLYRFQVCPPRLMLLATGLGVPSELYTAEMGPALKLASQIIISLTLEPPAVLEVKRS